MQKRKVAAAIRKFLFLATGRVILSDAIRNSAYQWAWNQIRAFPVHGVVMDIGCRDSSFPAFLAWRGYLVTAVEKDGRFASVQREIAHAWKAAFDVKTVDIQSLAGVGGGAHVVTALFSLQHAGESDAKCYAAGARLVKPGGLFLIVNQYQPGETRWHRGRKDGDMTIYGDDDVTQRIGRPLTEAGMTIVDLRFCRANFAARRIARATPNDQQRNVILIAARR